VTIGLTFVPDGTSDGTAPDPDFNSALFGGSGHLVGGWFNVPPTNGQGAPNDQLRVLIAQLSVRTGFRISGSATIFVNDGTQPLAASFAFCTTAANCGDLNDDGRRDDACAWYACAGSNCVTVSKPTQADIGGANGTCPIDTACDGNDRFHALNCFSNHSTLGVPGYPCESSAPSALNVDAGGPASCALDGVCDGNDAFHAVNCFSEKWFDGSIGYQCGCAGPAPSPAAQPLPPKEQTGLVLKAAGSARPGDLIQVDVHLSQALGSLRGYQLHLAARGESALLPGTDDSCHGMPGASGGPQLVDIVVDTHRRDYAFAGAPVTWSAFNLQAAQMVVGMDAFEGVPVRAGAYLATFTYRMPQTSGLFIIEILHGDPGTNATTRTFLFGQAARPVLVTSARPASIMVSAVKPNR
jgi:hypothetical protein